MITRYPDVRSWSGGAVVCCICEQREEGLSSAGAIVLHATALRSVEVSAAASVAIPTPLNPGLLNL